MQSTLITLSDCSQCASIDVRRSDSASDRSGAAPTCFKDLPEVTFCLSHSRRMINLVRLESPKGNRIVNCRRKLAVKRGVSVSRLPVLIG